MPPWTSLPRLPGGWRRWLALAAILALVAAGIARAFGGPPSATPGGVQSASSASGHTPAHTMPHLTPTPTIAFARPAFQAGVAFPRFGAGAYGPGDPGWAQGLLDMQRQTGARWVEMEINFDQTSPTTTDLHVDSWGPSVADMVAGIQTAHQAGLKIFVVPHLFYGSHLWGGLIYFHSASLASAWFAAYWQALEPYLAAAQRAGADQFAVGNEYVGIEQASPALWEQLIAQAHAVYTGPLTYNMNWGYYTPYPWLSDPDLSAIGMSMYEPLAPAPQPEPESIMTQIWQQKLLPLLDQLSAAAGKPIILSEIGYKNAADALYQPWNANDSAPADPSLQAAAYDAATLAAFGDPHIQGIYFWGWSLGIYAPNGLPAARVLQQRYLSPAA